jgi:hypothetical protein
MAIQDKYKKQPKIDFNSDEFEDYIPNNKKEIDFNSPDFIDYNSNVEIKEQKEKPQVQKNFDAFGTGMINMGGIRAPITGAMTGVAGLIGKAFGKNKKSFWENYQDGRDFVKNEIDRAKDDNSTAYHTGNIAGTLLMLSGANKASGGVVGKALMKGKQKAQNTVNKVLKNKKIAEALKNVGKTATSSKTKKAIMTALAYEGIKNIGNSLIKKVFAGDEKPIGDDYGTN